jgi:hypothetical protein
MNSILKTVGVSLSPVTVCFAQSVDALPTLAKVHAAVTSGGGIFCPYSFRLKLHWSVPFGNVRVALTYAFDFKTVSLVAPPEHFDHQLRCGAHGSGFGVGGGVGLGVGDGVGFMVSFAGH